MELAGGVLILVVLVLLAGLLASALFVHVAAKFSGVPDATFGKAVKVVIVNALVSFLLSLVFSIIPLAGTLLGMILSLAVTLWVFKAIYRIGWAHSLLLWVMQWVVLVVMSLALAALLGVGIFSL